jgi:(p)ppGpp synthase/HD superfamily hydrolase
MHLPNLCKSDTPSVIRVRLTVKTILMKGYSDRINHALAFAAKHHDQQVRRGTRPLYFTQPANVALILTRYACDEDTVVTGILLDVVRDYARETVPSELMQNRIADKFGARVLDLALMATERRVNDDGLELSVDERRIDLLVRLENAEPEARVLAAAAELHTAGTLLADLKRTVDARSVWARVAGGRGRMLAWYQAFCDRLSSIDPGAPLLDELRDTVDALEAAPNES